MVGFGHRIITASSKRKPDRDLTITSIDLVGTTLFSPTEPEKGHPRHSPSHLVTGLTINVFYNLGSHYQISVLFEI